MSMPTAKPAQFDPVFNISSIFTAHRDLRPFAKLTLGNSGLTIEEADILVLLLGASQFNWDDVPVNSDGFVSLKYLKEALVHDHSLFGRRIKKLAAQKKPLVEVRRMKAPARIGLHGNSQEARITKAGIAITLPIWETFRKLSAKVMEGVPEADLQVHLRVNAFISKRLHHLADPAKQLQGDVNYLDASAIDEAGDAARLDSICVDPPFSSAPDHRARQSRQVVVGKPLKRSD